MNINGHTIDYVQVETLLASVFKGSQHRKRLKSIANAALGVLASGSLIIHRIGQGLARCLNLINKHAIKPMD